MAYGEPPGVYIYCYSSPKRGGKKLKVLKIGKKTEAFGGQKSAFLHQKELFFRKKSRFLNKFSHINNILEKKKVLNFLSKNEAIN